MGEVQRGHLRGEENWNDGEAYLWEKETSRWKHPMARGTAKPLEQGGSLGIGILTEHQMFYGDPLPTCMFSAPPAYKARYFLGPRP